MWTSEPAASGHRRERGRTDHCRGVRNVLYTKPSSWLDGAEARGWFRGAAAALREVATHVDDDMLGIGLVGQMHGSVFLNAAGSVIWPAPPWNDQRTPHSATR